MPRFFFDIQESGLLSRDETGVMLEDAAAARSEAHRTLPELITEALPWGEEVEFLIELREGEGPPLYRARLLFQGEWLEAPTIEFMPR